MTGVQTCALPIYTIVRRIAGDGQRPSLTGTKSFTEEVAEVLARRTPLYQRLAHYVVDTDARTIDAVVAEIERLLDEAERPDCFPGALP